MNKTTLGDDDITRLREAIDLLLRGVVKTNLAALCEWFGVRTGPGADAQVETAGRMAGAGVRRMLETLRPNVDWSDALERIGPLDMVLEEHLPPESKWTRKK